MLKWVAILASQAGALFLIYVPKILFFFSSKVSDDGVGHMKGGAYLPMISSVQDIAEFNSIHCKHRTI